jgi:hypothetical protein
VPRPTRGPKSTLTRTGLSPALVRLSRRFRFVLPSHWPGPRSLAATDGVSSPGPKAGELMLMSFPPATEMFQFAGFASPTYGFSRRYPLPGGLPHSEISGSTGARPSPELFAACHVLHRLSVPRHPPDALLVQPCPRPAPSPRARAVRRGIQRCRRRRRAGQMSEVRCQMSDRTRPATAARPLLISDLRAPSWYASSTRDAKARRHGCIPMPGHEADAPCPSREYDAPRTLTGPVRLRTPTVTTSPARFQISDVGCQMSEGRQSGHSAGPAVHHPPIAFPRCQRRSASGASGLDAQTPQAAEGDRPSKDQSLPGAARQRWWAWADSNGRPHAYQACALTD